MDINSKFFINKYLNKALFLSIKLRINYKVEIIDTK